VHPKNIHNTPYDFLALIKSLATLEKFVFTNTFGNLTLDFSNPEAVLELNKAILKYYYAVHNWDIPKGYLCPPIPGRVDYIHHINDLLETNASKSIKGLDIGTGANCIYPILAAKVYNWTMVGSDINKTAIAAAIQNIETDSELSKKIEIRFQESNANIFDGIIKPDEYFDFTICNPPFHKSKEEAQKGTLKKLQNLKGTSDLQLNFGGQSNELWCNGGEALFIKRMIKQSISFANQVGVFTCLVSKKENLPKIEKQLNKIKADHTIIEMSQGNKKSRCITWKFKT